MTAIAFAPLVACGEASERDQWTIRVTTDAPVPQLVDRALVEILDDTGAAACEDCQRQIGLPTDASAWPISFGIAKPASNATLHVRVRLYRAARSGNDGLPLSGSAIDALGALPAPSGATTLSLVMHADCLGVGSDLTANATCVGSDRALVPEPLLTGTTPDDALRPGDWAPAKSVPCSGAADDMVCLPGGFFVLGDSTSFSVPTGIAAIVPERFVTLSPFALDRTEMTVGAVRALIKAARLTGAPVVQDATVDLHSQCTYLGPDDATNDALPLSCVSHDVATEVCAALGKRLPTEAEWEWAAGNLTRESVTPWDDPELDTCDEADVGLGRFGPTLTIAESLACRFRPGVPARGAGLPASPNPRDRTELGILSMAGGLAEWVQDFAATYAEPCWHPESAFLVDPACTTDPGHEHAYVVRGNSWADVPALVSSVGRQAITIDGSGLDTSHYFGFRCALSRGGDAP